MKNRVCELLGITYPIIQGGMAFYSKPKLVSAVSNAGGLGLLAGATGPKALQDDIDKTKELTNKPFGVNIPLALIGGRNQAILEIALEKNITIFVTAAGNPEQFAAIKERVVIETARHMTALNIDVLKAEFPTDLRYQQDRSKLLDLCRQLDMASQVPWVILSAGVDFDRFYQEVEIACQAGASGFLGGRAIWQEAMHIDDIQERTRYLSTVAVDRLKKLTEIASKYAVPWYRKFRLAIHELAEISERWYQEY